MIGIPRFFFSICDLKNHSPRPESAFASTLGFALAFGFTFAWPGDGNDNFFDGDGMVYCWWFRNPKAHHRLDGAKNPVNV